MIGFVYIWRDRKHNRYYVGSHWGRIDDGYVCSSAWMKRAYRLRPEDFKRRILEVVNDRSILTEREHRWLQMMKKEELKTRYYNLRNHHFGHWTTEEDARRSIGQKIGDANRGRKWTEEQKVKLKGRPTWNKGKTYSLPWSEDDPRRGRPAWNKGTGKPKVLKGRHGRIVTDETRRKISMSKTGNTTHTEETKARISRSKKGSIPWNKGMKTA